VLVGIGFVLCSALLGASLLLAARAFSEALVLALVSLATGLALTTTATFALAAALGSVATATGVVMAAAATGAGAVALATRRGRSRAGLRVDRRALGVLLALIALLTPIASRLLFREGDGLFTAIRTAQGDLPWHVAIMTLLEARPVLPPENPYFAGHPLIYSFLADFLGTVLLSAGAGLRAALLLPAYLLLPALFGLYFCLVRALAAGDAPEREPDWTAPVATLLFVFGGATLGFTQLWGDLEGAGWSLARLAAAPERPAYSGWVDPQNYPFVNPLLGLFLPQRSWLLGMPVAFSILLLLLPDGAGDRRGRHLVAGVLAGLLPLLHAHSVIALVPPVLALFALRPSRDWAFFALPAAVLGLPEVAYFVLGSEQVESAVRWQPGWLARESSLTAGSTTIAFSKDENLLRFWLKNTGLVFPLALLGLFVNCRRELKALAASALALLVVANLWIFAQWEWDNIKLILYAHLLALPLAVHVALRTLRAGGPLLRAGVVLGVALHGVSAAIDVARLALPGAWKTLEWGAEEVQIAEQIRAATRPGDVIAAAPVHNSPVVLAGRPLYVGNPLNVWSHSLDAGERLAALAPFFGAKRDGLPGAEPAYVLVDPAARRLFSPIRLRADWQLVATTSAYSIWATRPAAGGAR
jgi:hypothetical protein